MTTEVHGGVEYHVVPSHRCYSTIGKQLCALHDEIDEDKYHACIAARCTVPSRGGQVCFLTRTQFAAWTAARLTS